MAGREGLFILLRRDLFKEDVAFDLNLIGPLGF